MEFRALRHSRWCRHALPSYSVRFGRGCGPVYYCSGHWPLTYWPHKALCQFILSSKTSAGEGITGAVTHYYGKKIGNLITTLYFIAFFVVVLIYAVAITNSLTEQLAKHMVIDLRIRMLVSLGVVLILNLIFLMGRHATIRVMGFLVFPLIAYFLFLSIYWSVVGNLIY